MLTTEAPMSLRSALDRAELAQILAALKVAKNHRGRAAELLGISRKNLWEKLRRRGLNGLDADLSQ